MRKPLLLKSLEMISISLSSFVNRIHAVSKGKDAVCDLIDAVLTTPRVKSFVELSLSPVFRRKWSSTYAALRDSRPPRRKLMKLYIEQMPTRDAPVGGDHTGWPRPEAVTLKDRTIEHQPTQIAGNKMLWVTGSVPLDTRSTRKLGFTVTA